MTEDTLPLKIDTRESDDDILEAVETVAEDKDIPVDHTHLETGDYVVGDAAIELKTINDAVQSALDDRLYKQADRLADEFERCWIIVVGKIRELDTQYSSMNYQQQYGQMVHVMPEIMAKTNIPILWVDTPQKFADLGVRALIEAGKFDGKPPEKLLVSPGSTSDSRVNMLSGIDTVGAAQAKTLLDEFGSIEALTNARFDEFLSISGIGWSTARKIHNSFHAGWDGTPGLDADAETLTPAMEFLHTSGVGDDILVDIYASSNELMESPHDYLDNEYPDIGTARRNKIVDALPDNE